MKKLFALMLALCLMGSVAMADANLTWDAVAETAEQVDGGFQTFDEIAVKIWMPAVLQAVELTDEDKEAGYIGYYATADESAAVSVMYVNVEGMTLEEYEAELKADSAISDIEAGTVNGLPAVSYVIKEKDTAAVAFTTEKGYILEVSVGPMEDENAKLGGSVILASSQAAE